MSFIDESIMAELAEIDKKNVKPAENLQKPKIEDMPEGVYDFEIQSGEFRKTSDDCMVFQFTIRILGGNNDGVVCTSPALWLRGKDGEWDEKRIGSLLADFVTLGFDADKWEGDRTFSKEVVKVMPKLKGIKAKGVRRNTQAKNGKVYNNFNISAKLPANYKPEPPKKFDFTPKADAATSDEIPF